MIKHGTIAAHAAARPSDTALVDLVAGHRVSWAELSDLVAHTATGLTGLLTAQRGHRLRAAFLAENRWEIAVLQGAAATIGLPLVGVDDSLPVAHIATCLRQIQPAVLIVSAARWELANAALELLAERTELATRPTLICLPDSVTTSGKAPENRSDVVTWQSLVDTPVDTVSWVTVPFEGLGFTSGTTGAPKLVLRSKSFEARRQQDVTDFFGITPDDVYLNTVPLYHASGPGWAKIFLTHGATVVVVGQNDPASVLRALTTEGVTATLAVPPTLQALLDHIDAQPTVPPVALRWVVTGGRHVSGGLIEQSRRLLGDVLHVYYGTTETGLNTLTVADELTTHPTTAGLPFPGNDIVILDEENRPVPAETVGRVAIRSYMLADGYAMAPAPMVDLDRGDSVWVTADSGRLDTGGRLHLTARDLPASARHVDVIGLESHLKAVLPVADTVVLTSHEQDGPRVCIAYTIDPTQPVTADEVAAAAAGFTAGVLTRVRQVPTVPYSPTGKVRVTNLRELMRSSRTENAVATA
jgi:acyl-coenzyme A synthetase/AMP-(fatty) acid ligase